VNAKVAIASVGALLWALVRCGGDACQNASDQLAACAAGGGTPSSSSSSSGMTPACDGAYLCKSNCVNAASCAQITANDPTFTACMNSCSEQ
jgi:hypothetical protein